MEVKKILFPIHLTDFSSKIAQQVISVAEKYGAEIHIFTVVEGLKGYDTFFVPHASLDVLESEGDERAERILREFDEEHFLSYRNVKLGVATGRPADEIVKYIQSHGIDLVIMASHRREGLERLILGSVADEVIKRSPVPVMTINPSEAEKGWRVSKLDPSEKIRMRPEWRE